MFEKHRGALAGRRHARRLPGRPPTCPKVITIVAGIGQAGKTTTYIRKRDPKIDTDKPDKYNQYIAISTRCMHLGCPVRFVEAAERFICPCHGGVYGFTGKVDGGPPVRPLDRFYTARAQRPARARAALLGQRGAQALLAARPGRAAGRHRPVPLPVAAHRSASCRGPRPCPSSRSHRPPKLNPAPKRPGEGNGEAGPLDTAAEAGISAVDWIDERTSLSGAARWMMFRKVPKGTNWFYTLGTATMFAFLNQAVTGVFLAMYYDPSPTRAYESARYITNEAFLGEFVRGMHKWGSSVMVILIFLHMARTFFFGAYKYPRELNWVIGVVLVILTFVMALTGYLLPFDQRSLWATVVANNITASGPLVGPYLGDFLRGGPEFGATTLSRFYAIHMLLVPGRHRRAHRRAPVPRGQARHHGAAVAAAEVDESSSRTH